MFNLFSLFSSNTPHKKSPTPVPPDLAIMLVMKFSKKLKDFDDGDDLSSKVESFADELDEITRIQERMSYEEAVAALRRLDELSAP
jgi:hypothetical protein